MTRQWRCFAISLLSLAAALPAAAFVTESQSIFGTYFAYFGTAMAASGDTLVVSSRLPAFLDTGDVSVYRSNGSSFALEQTLTASDGVPFDRFGYDVAIDGDVLVVGMLRSQPPNDTGKAYVFRRSGTTWTEEQILIGSGGSICGQLCARWVSVWGDVITVGDTVFRWNGASWVEEQVLTLPAGYNERGSVVSGSTILLGADVAEPEPSDDWIFVFVWTGSSWVQQAQLTGSGIIAGEAFGGNDWQAMALDGDVALIGAPFDDGSSGTAYVLRRTGTVWTEEQILTGFTGDQLGSSVALGPDVAVVGARGGDVPPGFDQGTAHLFRRAAGTWVSQERLIAGVGDCGGSDFFATSAALAGDVAFVGAPEAALDFECAFLKNGAAYVYDIPLCGNGALALSEACDDGNAASGDGCSATCQLEPCNDSIDNDGDGAIDFPADPGCQHAGGTENPKCQNGLDDDGDAGIDFDGGAAANGGVPLASADPNCTVAWKTKEAAPTCGLGSELALLVALAHRMRRRAEVPTGRA